jgi:crotonobetainyl-CoA:carnitine CoA-transferase CaiB-like acyl-CoA transferase
VIAKFSEKPSSLRTPSPLLGEHSEKILLEHGFSKKQINKFRKNKVIS